MQALVSAVFCVTLLLLAFLPRWKERRREILHARAQIWAELGEVGFMLWQSWKFIVLGGWLDAPLSTWGQKAGAVQNAAGAGLSTAVHDFWVVMVGGALPAITMLCIITTICGVLGFMEKRSLPRILCALGCLVWTVWGGWMLTLHTPDHLSGGLYFGGAFLAAGTFIQISAQCASAHEVQTERVLARLTSLNLLLKRTPLEQVFMSHRPARKS